MKSPTCETHEISLSALIDGELDIPEQLPTVDHLLECADCREFYRRSRALGGMVMSATEGELDPAPPEVWNRIQAESLTSDPPRRHSGWPSWPALPRYVASLAAAVVLDLALGWFGRAALVDGPAGPSRHGNTPADGSEIARVDLVLEENRGSMTEERFLQLTTELLRADRQYHDKMLEVMSAVAALAEPPEGSVDRPSILARDQDQRISIGEDDAGEERRWGSSQL